MKAQLQPDGSLALSGAEEIRIVKPTHARYAELMALFHQHVGIQLSATHAPKGYTKSHPLQIQGHAYVGGNFIPSEVVADATPAEVAKLDQPGPEKDEASGGYHTDDDLEHVAPPGFGGHPWKGGTPEYEKTYQVPVEDIRTDPARFQYKHGADAETGVVKEHEGEFDPDSIGELSGWKDRDGKTYIVDGHHRLQRAKEHGMETVPLKYIKANSAEEAKAIGAKMNGHRQPAKEKAVAPPSPTSLTDKQLSDALNKANARFVAIKPDHDRLLATSFGGEDLSAAETHRISQEYHAALIGQSDLRAEANKRKVDPYVSMKQADFIATFKKKQADGDDNLEGLDEKDFAKAHRHRVARALEQGKPVPKEVLAEYPSLAPITEASKTSEPATPRHDQGVASSLPKGWSIKPVGKKLGLFREGRKTPVAKADKAEDLVAKIAIPKAKVPVTPENAAKSAGHVAFVGKHEYYRGSDGRLYKATIGSKITKTGNRNGNLTSEGEMAKAQTKARSVTATPARTGQSERLPDTVPPALAEPKEKQDAPVEAAQPKETASTGNASTGGHGPADAIEVPAATTRVGAPDRVGQTEAKASKTPTVESGFTGQTVGEDGKTYYFVDGKPVKGPEEVEAATGTKSTPDEEHGDASYLPVEGAKEYIVSYEDKKGKPGSSRVYADSEAAARKLVTNSRSVGKVTATRLDHDPDNDSEDWIKNLPEVEHDDELAGESQGSSGAGLPAREQLGGDAAPTPEPMLPGSREGTGGKSGSVPASDDVRSDADVRAPGGPGDAKPDGGGVGAEAVAGDATGRTGDDATLRDGAGSVGPGGSSPTTVAEQSLNELATPENPTDLAAGNFHYGEMNFEGIGLKTKFKQNMEAIRTLRAIELEGRTTATPAEQEVMSKYVGWGAFPGIFKDYGDEGFDRNQKDEWKKEAAALQSVLSEDEWRAARGSILNAHYTNPDIVKLHWEIAQRLGFKGGRFLETSAGIGYYLGMMPGELANRTHSSAVELDQTTGKMLKLLYPSTHVNVMGFEQYKTPPDFFDLIASNVPFGDYKVHDPNYNKHQANIHDYFFLKSVDKVRPGGLVMHITSTGTMDKADSDIRAELAKKCELVSAFRMPDTTHKENAGTEVVTDMIILRKKVPGEQPVDPKVTPKEAQPEKRGFTGITTDSLGRLYHWKDGKRVPGPNWLDVTQVPCPRSTSNHDGGEPITINQYFADHPEQIIGELNRTGKLYGGDQKNVSLTDDADERLAAVIDRLPHNIMVKPKGSKAFEPESMPAPGDVRPGGFSIKNSKLYRSEEGRLVQQVSNSKNTECIQGMMDIRDATRAVINAQTSGQDATEARAKLNQVYDDFVAKHGFLNAQANKRAFRGDPDGPLLLALENWNNEGKTASKSDMFSKDTIRRVAAVTHADTTSDALAVSLQEFGRIDLDHMAKLLGKDTEAVKQAMIADGIAFEEPGAGMKPADEYLSGNVRRKLVMARAAAEADPKFKANVAALEKVQPEDVDYTDITARLGASWIPASDVKDFAAHLLSANPSDFDIRYVPQTGEWLAHYTNEGERHIKGSDAATTVWGVEMELPNGEKHHVAGFMDILKATLSGRSMIIKKTIGEGEDAKEVVDSEATDACRAKVQEMKDAFCGENGDGWIWEDDARRERLHRFYNDNFNNIRHMEYNGSHLKFPGMNPAIKLHPHIPNFVWQVVTTGKGLAAHEVGTGKTYTQIASAMELRRLGLAKKPCIACLKANIEAITADCLKLYPGAKILSTADMFSADKRKKTISQIATGDYDIVLMTHDNLNMLPMRPETQAKYIQEELDDLYTAMGEMQAEDEKSTDRYGRKRGAAKPSRSVKAMEKAAKNLEAKLKAAMATEKKDDAVYFEDLGVDALFVDEAHAYKTLPVYSKKDRVKGVPNGRSQRATNMLMRTRWLQEQNGGRGVVFATGTPVSNTMAELYTMQRYLQPEALKERGIDKFDAWANLFGDEQTKVEVSVAGEVKPTTRFAKFVNIPELMQIARQVVDVRRADDIKKPDGSPAIVRPNRHDKVVVAPHSDAVAKLMASLKDRAEQIKKRSGPPQKGDDNMLVICTDGRKGALDMRLLNPKAKDDPESKTNQAVANILRIAKERPGQVQLIFSDVGVNPMKVKGGENAGDDEDDADLDEPSDLDSGDVEGMRWYGDVIDKLVKGGIPREKIADFSKLSGQAKEDAQAALRRGDMLIGIGSTKKMGTGVNIQNKITAMHHLDVPWVPAAIEQRNGRGIRFGNENKDVDVITYVTEGSLDQMFWQVVGTKANFIKQVMTPGNNASRVVENQDTEQLSPEQLAAVASGDPRWLEKANLDEDIKNLQRARVRHDKEQAKFRKAEEGTSSRLASFKHDAEVKATDAKHLANHPDFRFEIGDVAHTERKAAEESFKVLREKADAGRRDSWDETPIGTYRGMNVFLKGPQGGTEVYLRTPSGTEYKTSGSLQGIEAKASLIQKRYHVEAAKDAEQAEKDLANIRANLGKRFTKGDELQAKIARSKAIEESLRSDSEKEEDKRSHKEPRVTAPAKAKSRYRTQSRAEERGETVPTRLSMAVADPEVSDEVRQEAVRALREMFPISDYADME